MNKKIYVVGGSLGYAEWMLPLGNKLVYDKNDADIFVFTGGADLDPELYGEPEGSHTYCNKRRSAEEKQYFDFAVKNGIKMWGTCLGSQTLGVLGVAGTKLIQHVNHPSNHKVILPYHKNLALPVPSCHHQLVHFDPNQSTEGKDYLLIAYTPRLSPVHLNGYDQDYELGEDYKEVEGFFIPSIGALSFQTHFEFLNLDHPSVKVAQNLFEEYLS